MSKYLIVGGDSFTTDHLMWHNENNKPFYKTVNNVLQHKTWGYYVGEHLGLETINTGKAGSGNVGIYTRIQDAVLDVGAENVGYVIAGWSKSERLDIETEMFSRHTTENVYTRAWTNRIIDPTADYYWFIRRSLRSFWQLQFLCESHNIPYFQFQMISLFKDYLKLFDMKEHDNNPFRREPLRVDILNTLTECEYYERIRNFYGWPIYDEGNGFTMEDHVLKREDGWNNPDLCLHVDPGLINTKNAYDPHPNAKGHQVIGDKIIENL